MAAIWYYKLMGEMYGPLTANQLREKAAVGEITRDAYIRKGLDGKWVSADRVSGLFNPVSSHSSGNQVAALANPNANPSSIPSTSIHKGGRSPKSAEPPKTKPCPFCAEQIAIAARKCKHCGEFLDGTLPRSLSKKNTRPTDYPERTMWEGHPSPLYYLGHWVVGVMLLPFLGVGLILIIYAILDQQTKVFTHTNKRVISKTGIISRTTNEVTITDVRSINMQQSLSERLFGLGTVQIGSAGTAGIEVEFAGITDPVRVRDQIRRSKDEVS